MKPDYFPIRPAALAAAPLLCLALSLLADNPSTPAAKNAKARAAATNTAPAVVEVPKSEFAIPKSPVEGKDPFFPKSMRLFNSVVIAAVPTTNTAAAPVPLELHLKGISGPEEKRLAIIDNATFEKGEEHEIPTSAGRVRIRCLEIASDSVIIQVGGEQRTLHLRPGVF